MRLKKFLAILMISVLFVALAGCGAGDKETSVDMGQVSEANDKKDGKFSKDVVAIVGDSEITVDEYRYFIFTTAAREMYTTNDAFDGNYSAVDWDAKDNSGKTLAERVKEKALKEATDYALIVSNGKNNGIEITKEDLSQINADVDEFISANGEDMFNLSLSIMGVTSVKGYKKLSELMGGYTMAEDDFNANRDKYIDDDAKFEKYADDEKVSVQHILILKDSEKYENPETEINKVLKRAKSGENFEALMTEFNEDPGQTLAGYSFGRGEMVPEFEKASYALGYGEISDVVVSDYGYHIIKRIPGLCEYTNMLREKEEISVNNELIDTLSVKDIMTEIYNATVQLQQQNGGNANG